MGAQEAAVQLCHFSKSDPCLPGCDADWCTVLFMTQNNQFLHQGLEITKKLIIFIYMPLNLCVCTVPPLEMFL